MFARDGAQMNLKDLLRKNISGYDESNKYEIIFDRCIGKTNIKGIGSEINWSKKDEFKRDTAKDWRCRDNAVFVKTICISGYRLSLKMMTKRETK